MLKKITSNVLSQIFAKVITATITIVLLGLLTNYFSVELFGVYNKIFNYIFIFAFLVDLGLYAISIKEISASKKNSEYIFGNILTLRIISAFFVIIFSVLIAFFLPGYNSSLVLLGIFIASIFSFLSLLNSSFLALMQAFMKIEFSIVSVVLNKLFVLGASFFIIKYLFPDNIQKGFIAIIAIVAIGMLINMLLNYFYSKSITKIKLYFDFKYIKKIFLKSLPYGIALFLSVVYTKIDIILLSLIEKGIVADRSIALYSLPLKIMDVFMIIGGFFMNSLLPSLTENYKNKNYKKIKLILKNAFKIMFASGIAIIAIGLIYRDSIIKLIANDNYLRSTNLNLYTSSDAFAITLFMILFFYLGIVFSYFLISIDKQKELLKISIILTVINIIGNIIFIPYFSFMGAGIMTVVTQIIFLYLVISKAKENIDFSVPYKSIFFYIILGFFTYFVLSYLVVNLPLEGYLNFLYAFLILLFFSIFTFFLEYTINSKN